MSRDLELCAKEEKKKVAAGRVPITGPRQRRMQACDNVWSPCKAFTSFLSLFFPFLPCGRH